MRINPISLSDNKYKKQNVSFEKFNIRATQEDLISVGVFWNEFWKKNPIHGFVPRTLDEIITAAKAKFERLLDLAKRYENEDKVDVIINPSNGGNVIPSFSHEHYNGYNGINVVVTNERGGSNLATHDPFSDGTELVADIEKEIALLKKGLKKRFHK